LAQRGPLQLVSDNESKLPANPPPVPLSCTSWSTGNTVTALVDRWHLRCTTAVKQRVTGMPKVPAKCCRLEGESAVDGLATSVGQESRHAAATAESTRRHFAIAHNTVSYLGIPRRQPCDRLTRGHVILVRRGGDAGRGMISAGGGGAPVSLWAGGTNTACAARRTQARTGTAVVTTPCQRVLSANYTHTDTFETVRNNLPKHFICILMTLD